MKTQSENQKSFRDLDGPKSSRLIIEFWDLARQHKKYWLVPLIGVLLLFGVLIALGGSAAAPFIYTLF